MKKLVLLLALFPSLALAEQVVTSPVKRITVTPTVNTAVLSAGEVINASIVTVAGVCRTGKTAVIQDITISDLGANVVDYNVFFFNSAIASYGNANDPFDPADADLQAYLAGAPIAVTSHTAMLDSSVSAAQNVARTVSCNTAGNLYMVLVAGGAQDFVNATDVKVTVGVLQ